MRLTPLAAAASAAVLVLATACAPADEESDDVASAELPDLSECQAQDLPLYEDGTLTIATDAPAYEPWFVDDDPSNGQGYEGAVARSVAEQLGFAPEDITWVTQGFNEAVKPGAKDFDFDINQFSITSDREKIVDFSAPYYKAQQGVIALQDSDVTGATSLDDLADAQLGAQVGTTSLEAAEQIESAADPLVYDDTSKAAQALQNGQVDAIIADVPTAYYLVAAELEDAAIVGQFEPRTGESEQFGLLLDKDSELTPCVSAAVVALTEDGTLADLQQEWLSEATDVPALD
ncbi:ABC transporter substrate-binding protein [Aeromicrobium sp. CTD01-1L150]|uniref:ABC transporter substrate-binding protein n=1 Tax=Aeromicrobium sp. CTD01-1L150 TaxID=3341830 RepID=UPI0035C194DD